jgi:hypothetical protein
MNALAKNIFTALELTDVTMTARFYNINARAVLLTPAALEALELDAAPERGLTCLHDLLHAAAEAIAAQAWAALPASEWRMPLPPPVPGEVEWQIGDRSPLRGQAFLARARFGGCMLIDLVDATDRTAALRLAA